MSSPDNNSNNNNTNICKAHIVSIRAESEGESRPANLGNMVSERQVAIKSDSQE